MRLSKLLILILVCALPFFGKAQTFEWESQNNIYGGSYVFAAPFLAVFQKTQVVVGSFFEWSTLLAMIVYWIVATGIVNLFLAGKSVSTPQAANKLAEQENL
jgi:hypothetical protein